METVGKVRVLIADDHAILRSGVRMMLESHTDMAVVGEAQDAETAVSFARAETPDVVLLDISMRGDNGIQAISRIHEVSPGTRVIMLTMHADRAYLRSALASGAAGYMVKTGVDAELVTAIRTVCRGETYIDASVVDDADPDVLQRQAAASERGSAASLIGLLSKRERQVLELVAYGHTHKDIAARLDVSVKSVETYRARVADKLGLRSRAELVRFALDNGVLGPSHTPAA